MTVLNLLLASLMLACLAAGLVRIARGPTISDSLLAIQFTATLGIGLLPFIGVIWRIPALIDIALVIAVLGVPATAAFFRLRANADGLSR